jgi:hypothetical protein
MLISLDGATLYLKLSKLIAYNDNHSPNDVINSLNFAGSQKPFFLRLRVLTRPKFRDTSTNGIMSVAVKL